MLPPSGSQNALTYRPTLAILFKGVLFAWGTLKFPHHIWVLILYSSPAYASSLLPSKYSDNLCLNANSQPALLLDVTSGNYRTISILPQTWDHNSLTLSSTCPGPWSGLFDDRCIFSIIDNLRLERKFPAPVSMRSLILFSCLSTTIGCLLNSLPPYKGVSSKTLLNFTMGFDLLGSSPTRDLIITSQMKISKPKLLLKSCSTFFPT